MIEIAGGGEVFMRIEFYLVAREVEKLRNLTLELMIIGPNEVFKGRLPLSRTAWRLPRPA